MNYSVNLSSEDIQTMDSDSLETLKTISIHLLDDCLNSLAERKGKENVISQVRSA